MTHTCVTCGRRFSGRRDKKTCSDRCRKQKSRTHIKTWGDLKAKLESMGLEAARELAKTDSAFKDSLIGHLEQHEEAHAPTGQDRVTEVDPGMVELLQEPDRRFSVRSDVYGERLKTDKDIDAAEASGDWSGMLDGALDGMTWQFAHGYRPDLSEFDRVPPMADLLAKSEEWLRSMEEQAETDSDLEALPGIVDAA